MVTMATPHSCQRQNLGDYLDTTTRRDTQFDPWDHMPHEHGVNLHMVGQKWWEEKAEPEVGKWSEKEVRTPHLRFLLDKFLFIWAPLWLTWVQLLVQKSNWTGFPNYTKCEDKVTISPGRPKTMWPGDRRAVGCGRHLGTWWPCSSFFFFFKFFFLAMNLMMDFIHFWIVVLQSVSPLCLDHKRYVGASPHHHSIVDNVGHGAHWDASRSRSIPSSTVPYPGLCR